MPLEYVLALSAALFTIGGLGALLRRHVIVVSMCIESMLAAVVLALVAFSRQWADPTGHVFALLVIVVAGAQSVVGLAIVISSLRNRATLDTEDASTLRW